MDCVKALRVRWAIKAYKRVKLNTYRESIGLEPIKNWSLLNFPLICCKILFRRIFCFCLQWRVKGTKYTALEYLLKAGTRPNEILKSSLGFMCGLGSIYLLHCVLKTEFKLTPSHALITSIFIGIVLAIGLAFFQFIRLIVLLTAQQLFTSQARIAILAYALFLAVSGPGHDYFDNIQKLAESIHCCTDVVDEAFHRVTGLANEPLSVLAKPFHKFIKEVEDIFLDVKNFFIELKHQISSIGNAIKEAHKWLKEKVEICNEGFGRPYDRCQKEFKEAAVDCVDKLGQSLSFMCHVDALSDICETTKVRDVLCKLPSIIRDDILDPISNVMKEQMKAFRKFADVGIHASYEFNLDLNSSKNQIDIFKEIKSDLVDKFHPIYKYFDYLQVNFAVAFILLTGISAFNYRFWYLHSDRHDNKYITRGLIRIDMERTRLGKNSIFPLKYHESQLYTQVYSVRMLKNERKKFKTNMFLVLLSSVPILAYIFLDFSLYIFRILLRKYGVIKIDFKHNLNLELINIRGEGFIAKLDAAILGLLTPLTDALDSVDTTNCFPQIKQPNYWRYTQICILLLLCIFLVVTEAYGLRLRHIICEIYYPDRQLYRDRWLYSHILSSRDSFFRYAKDQIIARLTGDDKVFRIGLIQRLIHTLPCGRKLFWFLEVSEKQCFVCGRPGDLDDVEHFHECPTCESTYCTDCLQELEKCPICFTSIDYSDSSIDEESGSSSLNDPDSDTEMNQPLLKHTNFRRRTRLLGRNSNQTLSPSLFNNSPLVHGISTNFKGRQLSRYMSETEISSIISSRSFTTSSNADTNKANGNIYKTSGESLTVKQDSKNLKIPQGISNGSRDSITNSEDDTSNEASSSSSSSSNLIQWNSGDSYLGGNGNRITNIQSQNSSNNFYPLVSESDLDF